ncbi:MAG: BatA domain-containing protein [Planctomycetaceae bacterium]
MENLFLNPAFVPAGAALAASPIIIHLINRLRFRRVRFAAMEFLLQAQQKNRRRILIEQLLLLLLRVLIVLAIMLLISRLILDRSILSLVRGTAAAHHLILIDDSGSMQEIAGQEQEEQENVFDKAKQLARQLADRAAKEPGKQKVTVLLLSSPLKALFREEEANEDFVVRLGDKLSNLNCSHQKLDVVQALQIAGETLAEKKEDDTIIKHLHYISDFRQEDWKRQTSIVEAVERLADKEISVNFIRAIEKSQPNLGITELVGNLQVATAGRAVRLKTTVKNYGSQVANNVVMRIIVDGQAVKRVVRFDKIGPGKTETQYFDVTFSTPGAHRLRVQLPSDPLPTDNTRYLAIENLPRFNKVLVVDGDPSTADSIYIGDALASNPKITGIQVETQDVDFLGKNSLDQYTSVYLLNVSELPDDIIASLTRYVKAGGGLAWFMGDSVNDSHYNTKLYLTKPPAEENAKTPGRVIGLFPVPLADTSQLLGDKQPGTASADIQVIGQHPIFEVLLQAGPEALGIFELERYWPVSEEELGERKIVWPKDDAKRNDGVTTIAKLRNNDPFMFEHRLGKGRIFTCLTTAGPKWWIHWSELKVYPPIINEIQKHIARRKPDKQRIVGQPIRELVPAAQYEKDVEIGQPNLNGQLIPYSADPVSLEKGEASESSGTAANKKSNKRNQEDYHQIPINDTDQPGIYTIHLIPKKGAGETTSTNKEIRMFAYNPPLEESEGKLAETENIQAAFSEIKGFRFFDFGDDTVLKGKAPDEDVRYKLLILLVLLLIAEQLLAYRLSYHAHQA